MYKSERMVEVERMVKDKQVNDLSLDTFATISGIKGTQFGREIYSTVIPFKDLMDFLKVFPDVQRQVINSKVRRIKNYVLSGLEDRSSMRFFSAITVTCRGHIFYDENTQRVAIDTRQSRMSINDGQHRFYGINEAIMALRGKLNSKKLSEEEISQYKAWAEELNNMVIPIVIFNQISEKEEKQLFHDLNKLPQRPSRSATIKLAQTDIVAVMAREIAEKNRYMLHYGVESDRMSIQKNNTNTILLTTIYGSLRELFKTVRKKGLLTEKTYEKYYNEANKLFDQVFLSLPSDIDVKGKYVVEKNYTIKGIFKFIYQCQKEQISEKEIFKAIEKVDWSNNLDVWGKYGASPSKRGKTIQFAGSGDKGLYAVYQELMSKVDKRQSELDLENEEQAEMKDGYINQ